MAILDFLFGSKDKLKKVPAQSPQQQQLLNSILSQLNGGGGLQQGYQNANGLLNDYLDPQSDVYRNFEQPYMQQFYEQTVPNLAERFAGMGAQGGALSSSGFGQALGAAGSQLGTNLAQMKSGLQRQSIQDILGQYLQTSGMALNQQPFAYYQRPAQQGFIPQAINTGIKAYLGGG